jgi:hypothetical protein
MDIDVEVEEKLSQAFHLMYDNFPEGVQLTHKSRRIVALNKASADSGRQVGMICSSAGDPAAHRGCLANKALARNEATWTQGRKAGQDGRAGIIFWLPVDGYPDYYVHFAVGYSKDYGQTS